MKKNTHLKLSLLSQLKHLLLICTVNVLSFTAYAQVEMPGGSNNTPGNKVDIPNRYDYDGALDIEALSNSLFVTAHRETYKKLRLISYKHTWFGSTGITSKKKSYYINRNEETDIRKVRLLRINDNRVCVIFNDYEEKKAYIRVYDVTNEGVFTRKSYKTIYNSHDFDIATVNSKTNLSETILVTSSLEKTNKRVRYTVWIVDKNGIIREEGSKTKYTSGGITAIGKSHNMSFFAGQTNSDDELYVQSWKVDRATTTSKYYPEFIEHVYAKYKGNYVEALKVELVQADFGKVIAVVNTYGDSKQVSLAFKMCHDTKTYGICRLNGFRSNAVYTVDATQLSIGKVITAGVRQDIFKDKVDNYQLLDLYKVDGDGDLDYIDDRLEPSESKIFRVSALPYTVDRFASVSANYFDNSIEVKVHKVTGIPNNLISNRSGQSDAETSTDKLTESNVSLNYFLNKDKTRANFSMDIKERGDIKLSIFSLDGKMVADVFSGSVNQGKIIKTANISNLPEGVYIYKLYTVNGVITKKMIISK